MALENASILVTGGSGQIGIAVVKHLQEEHPTATIAVLDLVKPPVGDARFMKNVTYFAGNITDEAIVNEVMDAVKPLVVFHTAGLIPQIAKRLHMDTESNYTAINFEGTKNVLEAARAVGTVKAFVFTSSADVVKGDSWQDLVNANESMPIPEVFDNQYSKSKAQAESFILSSSAPTLPTAAIRAHGVFSPYDSNLIPLLLSLPRNIHLGPGKNLYDFTYAPNLALAHVLAAENLLTISPAEASNPSSGAGKPFFVTNAEPRPFRTFYSELWAAADAASGSKQAGTNGITIPVFVAVGLAWVIQTLAKISRSEPFLTVKDLGDGFAQRWFDNTSAKELLGYEPRTSLEQGLKDAVAGYMLLKKEGDSTSSERREQNES